MRYLGDWNCKDDVERDFNLPKGSLKGCKIVVASYDTGDYDGSAFVLLLENGKLYEVNASHCSCYGLEGQWVPEEVTVEELDFRVKNGNLSIYFGGDAVKVLRNLKRRMKRISKI